MLEADILYIVSTMSPVLCVLVVSSVQHTSSTVLEGTNALSSLDTSGFDIALSRDARMGASLDTSFSMVSPSPLDASTDSRSALEGLAPPVIYSTVITGYISVKYSGDTASVFSTSGVSVCYT